MSSDSMLKDFLQDGLCLVLEPSQVFSAGIQSCLQAMGISPGQTHICRRFHEAKTVVQERKPRLIITEYEVDQCFGMALAEIQEKQFEDHERISIITSKNSSASAIAEAAEGQIDSYLLKPFPIETFRQRLMEVLNRKLHPTSYAKKIVSGKIHLGKGDLDLALGDFQAAKALNDKPALACFYAGHSYQLKGELKMALAEYKEGRQHQPLHYKCLVGEFEGLMVEKNYEEAYLLIEPIAKNYPITSKRLGQMFVAAVFTRHFDQLPVFYELFAQLDQRTPELIQISSMAVMTAGKFFIRSKDFKRATEYFDMAILIANRDLSLIEKVVSEFLHERAVQEAEYFLSKVSAGDVGSPQFKRLALRVDELTLSREQIVEKGRQLVLAGMGTPEIFELVVRSMAESGKETLAEAIINKALETHPDLRKSLYQILDDHLPQKPTRS